MKKYFLYELKKSAFSIACLALIATVIYICPILTSDSSWGILNMVWLTSLTGGLLAVAVPRWAYEYRMKKRSLDLYYALPLSHTRILAVKFLIGLITVLAPYTVAYWFGAFCAMAKVAVLHDELISVANTVYYVPLYFASILPIYFIYAISSFAFTRANKRGDGVFFVLFWLFAVSTVVSVICKIISNFSQEDWLTGFLKQLVIPAYYLPFSPLDQATAHFQSLMTGHEINIDFLGSQAINMAIGFTVTTLLAIGSTAGLFRFEKQAKAENAEQISDSPFGYKVMIPLFTVCLCCEMSYINIYINVFLYLLVAVGAYAVTAVYRRSMKIGGKQTIIFAASIAAGILLSVVCSM